MIEAHWSKHWFWLCVQLAGNYLLFDFGKLSDLFIHFSQLRVELVILFSEFNDFLFKLTSWDSISVVYIITEQLFLHSSYSGSERSHSLNMVLALLHQLFLQLLDDVVELLNGLCGTGNFQWSWLDVTLFKLVDSLPHLLVVLNQRSVLGLQNNYLVVLSFTILTRPISF